MNSYSVIIDHLPSTESDIERYLSVLTERFADAEAIIAPVKVDDEHERIPAATLFQLLEAHEVQPVPVQGGRWQSLNLLAATAKSSHLLMLEEDWWPSTRVADHVGSVLDGVVDGAFYFHRRDARLVEMPKLLDGKSVRSAPRPTDNPGYAFLIGRRTFLELRGYDERSDFSEVASIDLTTRLRRAGIATHHLDETHGGFYHFPEVGAKNDGDGPRGVEFRRQLCEKVERDDTIYRNLKDWSVPADLRIPLVTVAIATKNRGDIILDSLNSVLYQTFQDFEIIVVDDGSEGDEARAAVESLDDPRIRFVRQEPRGVSAARNNASDLARCKLLAVHDDDDIMLPDRLEVGIASLTASAQATFGGWVNFADETGEMRGFLGRVEFNAELNSYNGQGPGHSTWTLPTELLRTVRYDERIAASVDHHIASRLEWAGVTWAHTGKFMYLRRVHEKQITAQDGAGQKTAHVLTRFANNLTSSRDQRNRMREAGRKLRYPEIPEAKTLVASFAGYLPDRLVKRTVTITADGQTAQFTADMPERMLFLLEDRDLRTGRAHLEGAVLEPVTLADLARIRRNGLTNLSVKGTVVPPEDVPAGPEGAEDGDVEIKAEARVSEAVTAAVDTRTRVILDQHLKLYPGGSVLVIPDSESYHKWVDQDEVRSPTMARRILGAGEFGHKRANAVFGFTTVLPGASALGALARMDLEVSPYLITLDELESAAVTSSFDSVRTDERRLS